MGNNSTSQVQLELLPTQHKDIQMIRRERDTMQLHHQQPPKQHHQHLRNNINNHHHNNNTLHNSNSSTVDLQLKRLVLLHQHLSKVLLQAQVPLLQILNKHTNNNNRTIRKLTNSGMRTMLRRMLN